MAKEKTMTEKAVAPKMSIPKEVRARYKQNDAKTPSGSKGIDNGDELSKALASEGIVAGGLPKYLEVAKANGLAPPPDHLNAGHKAMNVRNRVRKLWRHGQKVKIGNVVVFSQANADAQKAKDEAAAKKKAESLQRMKDKAAEKKDAKPAAKK